MKTPGSAPPGPSDDSRRKGTFAPRELPDEAPFWTAEVTLVLVMKDGTLQQSHTQAGKTELLALAPEALHALAAWHGHWRTDVFTLSAARCRDLLRNR